MRDKYDLRRIIQNALAYNSTLNTQISTLRFAQQSVAGSGFAPQAHAYSVIPALPYYIIYYNRSNHWLYNTVKAYAVFTL